MNMALCLIGHKYLGCKDKKVATKCKATETTTLEMKKGHLDEGNSDKD